MIGKLLTPRSRVSLEKLIVPTSLGLKFSCLPAYIKVRLLSSILINQRECNHSYSLRCLLFCPVMQEWVNRPRNVDLHESTSLHLQLALVGWLHSNETLNSWLPSTKKVSYQSYMFISHVVTEIQSALATITMLVLPVLFFLKKCLGVLSVQLQFQHFKICTFSCQIHKMFWGMRTPASPQKKSTCIMVSFKIVTHT
jgi:hypothetical protein